MDMEFNRRKVEADRKAKAEAETEAGARRVLLPDVLLGGKRRACIRPLIFLGSARAGLGAPRRQTLRR